MTVAEFEEAVKQDLITYLRKEGEIDERFPDAPDIEEKWEEIASSYLPDGMREFALYPTASLGWMMYIGMAIAKYWDDDWNIYSKVSNLYTYIRDKRGYDKMDEYVRGSILLLQGKKYDQLEQLVGECASRTYNKLCHSEFESGSKEAFLAYVSCLHQLYLVGAAVQLLRMGYKMKKVGLY